MEPGSTDVIETIAARETWTMEDYQELLDKLIGASRAPDKLKALLGGMESRDAQPGGLPQLARRRPHRVRHRRRRRNTLRVGVHRRGGFR